MVFFLLLLNEIEVDLKRNTKTDTKTDTFFYICIAQIN